MEDRPGKIFVGGLDFEVDEEEFEKIFAKFGKITEVLLKRDPQNKRSRGFGFITYENPSDAGDAVKQLDKQDVKGKMIHVDHAVKPDGSLFGDRGGRGGRFRGSSSGFRDGFGSSRGRGFRGRGGPRSDRGGRGGFMSMGRGGDRISRGGFDDRRNGFPPRRSSLDRSYSDRDREPPLRRDDDRDRYGSTLDRDRYSAPSVSERHARDPYPMTPPRGLERDYPVLSRDYSPPRDYPARDRGSSRDYASSRDIGMPTRSSFDVGRESFTARDPYTRREEYTPRESRAYVNSREAARDYLPPRDSSCLHEYERAPVPRESFDAYGDHDLGRTYGGLPPPPPRGRSPGISRSAYTPPPRGAPVIERERHRSRDYSPRSRRPAPYDSHGGPPTKRSRPDDVPIPRGIADRDMPPRGILRDGPLRESQRGPPRDTAPLRGPPREMPREGGRVGPSPFRR